VRASSAGNHLSDCVSLHCCILPALADHTGVLTELTTKNSKRDFPSWMPRHQNAFDAIKLIVTSRDCLTTINFTKMPENKIFVTTDASDKCSGAVLAFGPSWEKARPVAFDSMTFKNAELNYPVHEKELLAIIRALKKWRVDLLGTPFFIYTDHKTLENFNVQKDLSRRQARWMELMSQFDAKIVYIKGEDNTVADALSCLPSPESLIKAENVARHPYNFCDDDEDIPMVASIVLPSLCGPWESATCLSMRVASARPICATLKITADKTFLEAVRSGYKEDAWCKTLPASSVSWPDLAFRDGLWYAGERLIIPRTGDLRETLFVLAMIPWLLALTRHMVPCVTLTTGLICDATLNRVMCHHALTVNVTNHPQISHTDLYILYQSRITGVTPLL
jgi:hypothetical protein